MNLAPPSPLQRHNGHQHSGSAPVHAAPPATEEFQFHTVTWQQDGFGFDATTGEFFTASPTALLVMQCLAANLGTTQILDRLTSTFDVSRRSAERDLESFLAELEGMGLGKS